MGNYPREESAMVLTDSIVYSFTSKEFEAFAQTNTRIILQMIKVFSRQLRTIHKQLASLLDSEEEKNPEEGLFNVMNAFYSSQHYKAAGQVGTRYKAIYPNGKYISQVDQIVRSTAEVAGRSFGNAEGHNNDAVLAHHEKPAAVTDGTVHLAYNKAEDLFEKGEFEAAYDQYHAVIEAGAGDEITDNAYIGAGKSLHSQKEYVRCLQLLTGFISQHPKSSKIGDALMYLGMCYMDMERPDKAIAFFDKAAILSGADIIGKIRELQKECSSRLQGA